MAQALQRLRDRKTALNDAAAADPRPTVILGEPEACLMPHSSLVPRQPGYAAGLRAPASHNVQLAVETGSGVIVHHDLVGNANDGPCLVPMAKAAASILAGGALPVEVVADAGHASAGAAAELEAAGVVTILPMRRGRTPPGYHGRDRFTCDAQADRYICPAGQELRRFSRKPDKDDLHRYRTAPGRCQVCPRKRSCTPAKRREVNRSIHAAALERAVGRSAARPEAMHARKTTVEPTFGTFKRRFGGRFLLRGEAKAASEIALAVLAHNLARVARLMGARQLREALA
jgi:transposase